MILAAEAPTLASQGTGSPRARLRVASSRHDATDRENLFVMLPLRLEFRNAFHQMSGMFQYVVSDERNRSFVVGARSPVIQRVAIFPFRRRPKESRLFEILEQSQRCWAKSAAIL